MGENTLEEVEEEAGTNLLCDISHYLSCQKAVVVVWRFFFFFFVRLVASNNVCLTTEAAGTFHHLTT